MQIENTSDPLPVTLELIYPASSLDIIAEEFVSDLESNPKIDWSKFSQEEITAISTVQSGDMNLIILKVVS